MIYLLNNCVEKQGAKKLKETNEDLTEKLKFLGLDLENIPEYLKDFTPLNFNISRMNNDKDHKVYRYVPIDKIEILLTPCGIYK